MIAALMLGAFTLVSIPREEEPQIIVPMIDILVQLPGASAREVDERVSSPLEHLIRDIRFETFHAFELESMMRYPDSPFIDPKSSDPI